jgi:hypothetical protein
MGGSTIPGGVENRIYAISTLQLGSNTSPLPRWYLLRHKTNTIIDVYCMRLTLPRFRCAAVTTREQLKIVMADRDTSREPGS